MFNMIHTLTIFIVLENTQAGKVHLLETFMSEVLRKLAFEAIFSVIFHFFKQLCHITISYQDSEGPFLSKSETWD